MTSEELRKELQRIEYEYFVHLKSTDKLKQGAAPASMQVMTIYDGHREFDIDIQHVDYDKGIVYLS